MDFSRSTQSLTRPALATIGHNPSRANTFNASDAKSTTSPPSFLNMAHQLRRQSSAIHDMKSQQSNLEIGDTVEVPGGITGIVRYIGGIDGKNGEFAGVELSEADAARGKNDGDVDGIQYFITTIPGSGIFLPSNRAIRLNARIPDAGPPRTPVARRIAGHVDTPTVPFSQSVGPGTRPPFAQSVGLGARAPTPQSKLKPRPSLPRPASPTRKTPAPTLSSRPSISNFRAPASPLPQRIAKPATPGPPRAQSRSQSRIGERGGEDHASTNVSRPSIGGRNLSNNVASTEELRRLHRQAEEKDREIEEINDRLLEQNDTIEQLRSSLSSLKASASRPSEAPEIARMRAQLREKEDTIFKLNSDFEAHRSNFRDTINAVEAASSETERVYSARVQDLEKEVEELHAQKADTENNISRIHDLEKEIDELKAEKAETEKELEELRADRLEMETVADQFTQLEAMVLELEEGLEDARRSQSEAQRKVEELEGELERTRTELRSAKDDSETAARTSEQTNDSAAEMERKDDEIRGLKAIINSMGTSRSQPRSPAPVTPAELEELRGINRELEEALEKKAERETELVAENERLQAQSQSARPTAEPQTPPQSNSSAFDAPSINSSPRPDPKHSSATPSSTTLVRPFPRNPNSLASFMQPSGAGAALASRFKRDGPSNSSFATDDSATLWCEICEIAGHDVLSCRNVLAYDGKGQSRQDEQYQDEVDEVDEHERWHDGAPDDEDDQHHDVTKSPMYDWAPSQPIRKPVTQPTSLSFSSPALPTLSTPANPQSQQQPPTPAPEPTPAPPLAIAGETGPAPGKTTQRIDMDKWCAFCERDGHDSVDCPFEEEL